MRSIIKIEVEVMANQSKNYKNNSNKKNSKKKATKNATIMKTLVVLGVIVLCFAIVYLMDYFFVLKNDIKINMSTDKQMVNLKVGNKQEVITTQKYVSDLDYSMRYDIDYFRVFKYKSQDIFKYLDAEKILVVVEKSTLPSSCSNAGTNSYNSCMVTVDNYTEEQYIKPNDTVYKLTIKKPNASEYTSDIKSRIEYMISTFESTIK